MRRRLNRPNARCGCATPKPVEQRNFFYRGFEHVYSRSENGYTRLIGHMVRHAGLVVLIGVALAVARGMGHRPAADRLYPERGSGLSDDRRATA